MTIGLLPGSAAADPPAGAPGCPPGFFLVFALGDERDRNQNGLLCHNNAQVTIDDNAGAPTP
jgi:hypothetical protein